MGSRFVWPRDHRAPSRWLHVAPFVVGALAVACSRGSEPSASATPETATAAATGESATEGAPSATAAAQGAGSDDNGGKAGGRKGAWDVSGSDAGPGELHEKKDLEEADELGAVALPNAKRCVTECIQRNAMRAVGAEQIEADCRSQCLDACRAKCDAEAPGRPSSFGSTCRDDCDTQHANVSSSGS